MQYGNAVTIETLVRRMNRVNLKELIGNTICVMLTLGMLIIKEKVQFNISSKNPNDHLILSLSSFYIFILKNHFFVFITEIELAITFNLIRFDLSQSHLIKID